jgi:uncharacterized protein YjbJ (UPF0337 family)
VTEEKKECAMSIVKKLAHKAEAAKGATKLYLGRATGNTRLRTEGRANQAMATPNRQGQKPKTSSNANRHFPSTSP